MSKILIFVDVKDINICWCFFCLFLFEIGVRIVEKLVISIWIVLKEQLKLKMEVFY